MDHGQVFFRHQNLCETLAGNPTPVLTITAQPRSSQREDVEELCMLSHDRAMSLFAFFCFFLLLLLYCVCVCVCVCACVFVCV